MTVVARRTETNEVRWTGTIPGAEIKALLLDALCREVDAPRYGMSLTIAVLDALPDDDLPTFTFDLVHDRDWYMTRDADAPTAIDTPA